MVNPETQIKPQRISLNKLINAAQQENWKMVDANLPSVCNNSKFINWALGTGIKQQDGNLRDLAVSLIEKSARELKPKQVAELNKILLEDKDPLVRHRTAFALFAHGIQSQQVMDTLHDALQDEEIKEIAQRYLKSLNK